MSERNVETVQAIYDAFFRGDVDGIAAHVADDVVWDQDTPSFGLPWYEPRSGRAAIGEFVASLAQGLELTSFEPQGFLTGGDQVAVPVRVGMKVKGREIDDLEVHLWTFGADGKVVRFAHVIDRHAQIAAWRGIEP